MNPDEFYWILDLVMDSRHRLPEEVWVSLLARFMRASQCDTTLQATLDDGQRAIFQQLQAVINQYAAQRN